VAASDPGRPETQGPLDLWAFCLLIWWSRGFRPEQTRFGKEGPEMFVLLVGGFGWRCFSWWSRGVCLLEDLGG
jgi:hypothetical protein